MSQSEEAQFVICENEMLEIGNASPNTHFLHQKVFEMQETMDKRFKNLENAVDRALGSMAPRVQAILEQFEKHPLNAGVPRRTELNQTSSKDTEEDTSSSELSERIIAAAAARGDAITVQQLIEAGAGVNERSLKGDTPLHSAAREGRAEVAEVLICAGAEVNARSSHLHTPLHCAAIKGHSVVLQVLLGADSCVDLEDFEGTTAIALAASEGHKRIVQLLLKRGAQIQKPSLSISKAPLLMAVSAGHIEVVGLPVGTPATGNLSQDLWYAKECDQHSAVPPLSW